MDFHLTEEQQEVQGLARKILADLCTNDRLVEIEASEDGFDRRVYEELARANLLGVAIDEAHGGSGLGLLALGVLLEEIGRAVAPVPVLETLALGALPVAAFGTDEQKGRFLPRVAGGEVVLSGALTEAGAEDPARPASVARSTGGGFALSGVKECVPFAHLAERVLVTAATGDGGVLVGLLDPRAEGVTLERQRVTNRQPHFRVTLRDAVVGAGDVLGTGDAGGEIARWLTERATIAQCFVQLGVSDQALHMTAEYTRTREQFDRPVGSFQAVHQRAGDAYVLLEAMRLTTWQAAFRLAHGRPDEGALAIAKYWAAEGGQFVGYAAQHLHGGIGIDVDYPLHRYYLWAKQTELTLGSAGVQLSRLGEALAREPVHYEG